MDSYKYHINSYFPIYSLTLSKSFIAHRIHIISYRSFYLYKESLLLCLLFYIYYYKCPICCVSFLWIRCVFFQTFHIIYYIILFPIFYCNLLSSLQLQTFTPNDTLRFLLYMYYLSCNFYFQNALQVLLLHT